jgi:beta-lactamase class A
MRTLLVLSLILVPAAWPQDTAVPLLREKVLERIRAIDSGMEGALGVAAVDLTDGTTIEYHASNVFPQASVIKVPIMIAAFRAADEGRLQLDEKVTLQPSEAKPGGDLYSALQQGPVTLSIGQLIAHMIQSSDNTAANRMIEIVGMDSVNRMLDGFGLRETCLRRVMLDSAAVRRGDENVSTPHEMASLLVMLHGGKAASQSSTAEMIAIMKEVDGDIRKTVPPAAAVASKVGEYPGTRSEAAIVYLEGRPYAVSICATFLRPGADPIPDVAAAVQQYFEKLARSNRYGNLQ